MTTNPTITVELQINGTWTDVSSWVDVGDGGAAVVVTRGRENEQSESQPGVCTFSLTNDDGRFSLDLPAGAYYPHFKRWIGARVTISGKRRFTGYVSNVETTLDDETGLHSHSAITCTDTLGIQAMSPVTASWADQLISDLNPLYWWKLNDADSSTFAAAAAGGLPLVATLGSAGSGAHPISDLLQFGADGPAALEADTQASFTPNSDGGYAYLVSSGGTLTGLPTLSSGITILALYTRKNPNNTGVEIVQLKVGTLRVDISDQANALVIQSYNSSPVRGANSSVAGYFVNDQTYLIAVSITDTTVSVIGTAASFTRPAGDRVDLNGSTVYLGSGPNWTTSMVGLASHVAIVPGVLSSAAVDALRVNLLGGFGLTSAWLNRSLDAAGIAGSATVTRDRQMKRPALKGANPAEIGNTLAKACGGVYLAARDGTPTWLDPTYCPAWVAIPFDHIDPDVSRAPDDSLSYSEISVDGTPTASTGGFPKTELDIPGLLPEVDRAHYIQYLKNSADVSAQARFSQMTIDLLPLDATTTAAYLDLDVRSRILPTSSPAQFPSGQVLTIEGSTETATKSSWTLAFNTAPDPRFVLGDSVAGVLGSNYRLFWT